MKTIQGIMKLKNRGEKISMVTCYDFTSAKIVNETDVDVVLVGDSTAMVMHGHDTTIPATIEMMATHVAAVRRGLSKKILVVDMPFLAHRKDRKTVMESVDALMKAGANAVKIEGGNGQIEIIRHIVESDVPVMGHLGLTPQSVNMVGGWRVQGKTEEVANQVVQDAKNLESAGIFSLVLELVPSDLAQKITNELTIPTIGIGAGPHTSGQVLVFQDILGMNPDFNPTFLRKYMDGFSMISGALNKYTKDVKSGEFPNGKESF
jgi:3-methyl-2-oxobutanoate hydroxymethyltransferase|tara:strand:+ start:875 stop:1663 length:789 start_codon:yes stop_codon:yes gene_type:complete